LAGQLATLCQTICSFAADIWKGISMDASQIDDRQNDQIQPTVAVCQNAIGRALENPAQAIGLGGRCARHHGAGTSAGSDRDRARGAAVCAEAVSRWQADKTGRQDGPTSAQKWADNNEVVVMMDSEAVLKRAEALYESIPGGRVSDETAQKYRNEFLRMWNSNCLDPLQDDIALDTYYHRRGSLYFGTRELLLGSAIEYFAAVRRGGEVAARRSISRLRQGVERLEPILLLEPPSPEGVLPFDRPQSRWHASSNAARERGQNSKENVLELLKHDSVWDSRVWNEVVATKDLIHRDVIAVHMVAPLRPEETVPGNRPHGWSYGVVLTLYSERCLSITFAPVKSHQGLFGTGLTEIRIDPVAYGEPARYLAARAKAAGGTIVICTESKNAVRKAMAKIGKRALPELGNVLLTPYVFRHQLIADFKKTLGGGEDVAAAAGHGTDRTQSDYAAAIYGRKREGIISITALRRPRCGNVERARALGRDRYDEPDHEGGNANG
jgi:hypothetical protein